MNNIIVFTFFSLLGSVMAQECYMLVPQPQQIYYNQGICDLPENSYIVIDAKKEEKDKLLSIAMTVKEELAPVYGELYISASKTNKTSVLIRVAPEVSFRDQGYNLIIEPEKITISAGDCTGAFYALQTLKQIIRVSQGHLRCLKIKDWPDFPNRGVMLDISRDKVPSMDTLYSLVETLAELKINQFQLYTEHTFAYQNHSIVWQDSSPMTSQQVLELDKYCKQRYIELVPNQNSFGHMSRWLKHEPYRQYAEAPDGCETIWGWYEAFSLCPIDPRSIELLSELYDELLPNFSSQQFNVGCDETIDLGIVRSKQMCEEKGKGQVYLDFLMKIHEQLRKRDMTMMFWGDIIIKYPQLIEELPKDIVVLEWGYRADHPYNDRCEKYSQAAVPFYVCPGTSTWNSVAGRTDNAVSNLLNAAENGLKYGAIGFINTNWGDNGHWQPMSVCYLGYMYGAAVSWSVVRRQVKIPLATIKIPF
jgi:hexosaminidase